MKPVVMRKIFLLVAAIALLRAPAATADPGQIITSLLKVPLPSEFEFCGETVPLDREDVAERLEIELMVALSNPVSTSLWFKRRERYFPVIEPRIGRSGLPADLRYVPVVESNLRAEAVSSARAVGPWQFIRGTGLKYGLTKNGWKDDRRHWEEATDAALRYLAELHREFGSWPLALAAYNAGERRVSRAMETQGQGDYYGLGLPRETERYVFKIMAAKLILENPGDFGIDLADARLYRPEPTAEMTVRVERSRLPLSAVAAAAGVSYRRVRALNAWITGDALPRGVHTVTVPASAERSFEAALARWEAENPEPEVVYHRVQRGDTLSGIARKYGVRLNELLAWNSLSSRSIIRPGQRIAVRR